MCAFGVILCVICWTCGLSSVRRRVQRLYDASGRMASTTTVVETAQCVARDLESFVYVCMCKCMYNTA